jgi:hypothetical protein
MTAPVSVSVLMSACITPRSRRTLLVCSPIIGTPGRDPTPVPLYFTGCCAATSRLSVDSDAVATLVGVHVGAPAAVLGRGVAPCRHRTSGRMARNTRSSRSTWPARAPEDGTSSRGGARCRNGRAQRLRTCSALAAASVLLPAFAPDVPSAERCTRGASGSWVSAQSLLYQSSGIMTARAENHRFRLLSALRANTKAPYKNYLHRKKTDES